MQVHGLRLVMAGRLLVKFSAMHNAAAFGVGRAEYYAVDAGKADGGGAHGAGF